MKSYKLWLSVTFLLFTHWATAAAQSPGVVTGVVYSGDGAPAAGVRVYAFALQARADTANETPMESQATTDASGNYRLELPPGRYYIAAGSVSSPTYYPGTAELAASKVIPVGAGEVTANIDFSTFVPPPRSAVRYAILAPSRSGAVSGSVKYSDGAAAANITVVASPLTLVPDSGPPITGSDLNTIRSMSHNRAATNSAGRYEIPNLHPGTYVIVAGDADKPVFYPSALDENAASVITITTTRRDSLDIILPPDEPGTILKGRVLSSKGQALAQAEVTLLSRNSGAPSYYSLPSRNARRQTAVNPDGSFEFRDVPPGRYAVEYHFPGALKVLKMIVVGREPIDDLDLRFVLARLSGRVLMEDDTVPTGIGDFKEAILGSVDNPNLITTTRLPISNTGMFNGLHEGGTLRFFLHTLPNEYEVRSARAGTLDLLTDTLKVRGDDSIEIEVRVARRDTSKPAQRVSGAVVNGLNGGVPAIEGVTLCCLLPGPAERMTTAMKPDGTFEFLGVKPGAYNVSFETKPGQTLRPLQGSIEVSADGLSGLALISGSEFREVLTEIRSEVAGPLPANVQPVLVWTSMPGGVRVVSAKNYEGLYAVGLPVGATYLPSVENLPAGYEVKSPLTPMTVKSVPTTTGIIGVPSLPPPAIVIGRSTRQ